MDGEHKNQKLHMKRKLDRNFTNSDITEAISRAIKHAYNLQHPDGHWCGEFATGAFPTIEQVLFSQAIGIDISKDAASFQRHILSSQNADGSWSIAPEHPGDLSVSVEAYLALRLLGLAPEDKELQLARNFILDAGGAAEIRVLTRIFLAQFGLLPWDAVPQLPAELVLLPVQSPINIYTFWVPARLTIVPLLIIRHHEPIYALPNGKMRSNNFIDELWLDSSKKSIPYGRPLLELLKSDVGAFAFKAADCLMYAFKNFRHNPLRYLTRKKLVRWLLEHQNSDGSWFGVLPGYQLAIQALRLEGFSNEDIPIRRGLAAMESWMWEDENGKRIQLSLSPVWDTAMMMKTLCLIGPNRDDERVRLAAAWCKSHQLFGSRTDVAQYYPDVSSGGFAFEYDNPWYPDVDDTAAVALSMLEQDPSALEKYQFVRATEWVIAMQNSDGGWAAFDHDRNPVWLHKSPFNDMDNLVDPSTADITGRVLELCGLVIRGAEKASGRPPPDLVDRARQAAYHALSYLAIQQEPDGSWWGRWGSNYVFGTCNVIAGLVLFTDKEGNDSVSAMVQRGAAFLKRVQHEDGGWGESYATYDIPPAPPGSGPSLPSPTSWALLGLMNAGITIDDLAIQRGISWLLREQTIVDGKGGWSWMENIHTGVGFPRKLYIGFKLYQHYFPMMALGCYQRLLNTEEKG